MVARGYVIEREVKRRYGSTDDARLAEELGITVKRVEKIARRFCLAKDKLSFPGQPMPRWDEVEIAYLKDNYPTKPNLVLARELGRTVKAIVAKAHLMGLAKERDRLVEMGRQNISIRWGKPYHHK